MQENHEASCQSILVICHDKKLPIAGTQARVVKKLS